MSPLTTLFLVAVFLLAGPLQLMADVTGKILGTVTDTSGAVVVGANVTLRNMNTGLIRTVKSDSAGYQFLAVPIGAGYQVEVQATGFREAVQTGIQLLVNQDFTANFRLEVGAVAQTVQATAGTIQVETTSTELGDVIQDSKMVDMPLNGRDYINLLGLQAGVIPTESTGGVHARNVQDASGNDFEGMLSVNGSRETGNSFMVNGGDVENNFQNGATVLPSLDAIQEFRLLSNTNDAEYGRATGAIVNVVTKGGTNSLHGDAYEFVRNDEFDSANYFDQDQTSPSTGQVIPNSKRGLLQQNQFGGTLGGPVLKDRLFYFTDYQGTRLTQGLTSGIYTVPTLAERTGDFSNVAAAGYSPVTGSVRGGNFPNASSMNQTLTNRLGYTVNNNEPYWVPGCTALADAEAGMCVFPNQMIPQAAWSPAAKGTLQFIPDPTGSESGTPFWSSNSLDYILRDDKAGARIDISTQRSGLWSVFYFVDDTGATNHAAGFGNFATSSFSRAQQILLSNTKTFGSSAVNELRLNYTRNALHSVSGSSAEGLLASYGFVEGGLGIIPLYPSFKGIPTIVLGSLGDNFGVGQNTDWFENTYQLVDNFSKVVGRHSFKFGADVRKLQLNSTYFGEPAGGFQFYGSETGNDFADFLLGAPDQFEQSSAAPLDDRSTSVGAYFQDSFKARPNLTVNMGLRWEVETPWGDTKGRIETFVPGEQSTVYPDAPEGWLVPGDPGIPLGLSPTRYKNFGPRIGVAYSPGFSDGGLKALFGGPGKTSIRAAFGIYYTGYEEIENEWEGGTAPFAQYWTSSSLIYLEEPYAGRNGPNPGQRFPFVPSPPGTTGIWDKFLPLDGTQGDNIHNVLPRSNQYNLTIQRQVGKFAIMTLGYLGNQGHHLLGLREANPGNAQLCLSISQPSEVAPGTATCGPFGETAIYTTASGTVINGTRPYSVTSGRGLSQGLLDFGDVVWQETEENSNYNALQVSLQRDIGDLRFLAAYTWSKSIDDSSGFGDLWTNPFNPRLSRALSAFDVPQNFVVSYHYILPFGKMFKSNRRLVTGWDISGITRVTSGFPVTISDSIDTSLVGDTGGGDSGCDFPDYNGQPIRFYNPRQSAIHQYFSADDFSVPQLGTFGATSRRFFLGPGTVDTDLALHKLTHVTEKTSFEIRAELFNAFNHTQFVNPSVTTTGTGQGGGGDFNSNKFGDVTAAQAPRIGQVAAKFTF